MSSEMTILKFEPPKSEWGEGPWNDEPDRVDFEFAGFPCLALRNRMGAWCGYVGVPPGHPAHGKDYDSVDVDVHAGLTYAGECSPPICHTPKPGEPDDVYWLGFDCGHANDLMPGHDAIMRKFHIRTTSHLPWEVYRDMEYVEGQIRSLAEQLARMAQSSV